MSEDARAANRLLDSPSAYLRQHAHNPVDWCPWGPEALERARAEDRPILLSIGYSACHWCHVMARESFEDPETAALMNEHFVCIKVDREERPDLDALYMRAVRLMTDSGGWPLTVFLTPELAPFFGGGYFPPEERGELPSFRRVLKAVHEAYAQRGEEVAKSGADVLAAVRSNAVPERADGALSDGLWEPVMRTFASQYDMTQGGFGLGAKFPQAPVLDFLLRYWARRGDARARLLLTGTLDMMAAGGIFDHLGGGFHRYAVDREWRIPHFEKMLYDNAQLAGLYADSYRATGRRGYREAAVATADYLLDEMRGPEGGFFASQDADTDGQEGRVYAWTYAEVLECLGKQAGRVVARWFGVDKKGNWEGGLNVLHRSMTPAQLAGLFEMDQVEAEAIIRTGVSRLRQERSRRTPPGTDRKVLTDWNALAVSGLSRVWRATHDGRYLRAARQCAEFLLASAMDGGRLMHVWQDGRARVPAFLSDHALLGHALLDLYQAGFDPAHLRAARDMAAVVVADYWDDSEAVFREVGRQHDDLPAPAMSLEDQPVPSGNAAACRLLLRLGTLAESGDYVARAERLLNRCLPLLSEKPMRSAAMLSAALRFLSPPRELVIVGLDRPPASELATAADETYLPDLARAAAPAGQAARLARQIPLLRNRKAIDGRATAYLCSGGTCREPTQDPGELARQLAALAKLQH